jgi:chromosome segregation ATPase
MEFSLDHLEIIQTQAQSNLQQPIDIKNSIHSQSLQKQSSILDDLTTQIEDLQNKLKLNYRKLLLFESENEKLIQEKNKLFFDVKNTQEKFELLAERNEKLENYNIELESAYKLSHEKYLSFEKLCQTQSIDLKRLTKFHVKIKDIIKPYVQTLKSQIEVLNKSLSESQKMSATFEKLNSENILQIQYLKQNIEQQQQKFDNEKTNFIQSYEEQIHFLSKEIIQYQQKNEILQSEIFKQKKMNENKNFIENELIKFKRLQGEDQNTISNLKIQKIQLENTQNSIKNENSDLKNQFTLLQNENHLLSQNLNATRLQLNQKIDEIEKMHLRLKMLEKLNSNLSLSFTTQNDGELPKES